MLGILHMANSGENNPPPPPPPPGERTEDGLLF